jgi:hypothetical protein
MVIGAYGNTELRLELGGNSVKRTEGMDRQNRGVAVALDLRILRGLRRRFQADRDEYRECSDQMPHRPDEVAHFSHKPTLCAMRSSGTRTIKDIDAGAT